MNRKIRLINYPALFGTLLLIIGAIVLYFVIGVLGNQNDIFSEMGELFLGMIIVLCVFDFWYIFRAGITVENDVVVFGTDKEHMNSFPLKNLKDIRLLAPPPDETDPGVKRLYPRVNVAFFLADGSRKLYEARMLTRGQFEKLRKLFGIS